MMKQYQAFKQWLYNKTKTELDELYDALHVAQKQVESKNNNLALIAEHEAAIKTYKANRLWYDISKWSTNEKIARLWLAGLYALLCGISIFASIASLGIALAASALFMLMLSAAAITFTINLSGMWDNIAKLFDEAKVKNLKGIYDYGYKAFSWILIGTTSILATGLGLSTVQGALGLGFLTYWQFFPILLIFATTAYAMQGLYTQEPREWFKSFQTFGFTESIIRTCIRLWHGLDDPKFGDLPRSKWGPLKTNFFSGLLRVTLFTVFFSAIMYASYAFAPYAAKVSIQLLVDFLSHMSAGAIMSVNSTALAPLVPIFTLLFLVGSACYNASVSGRLAMLGGEYFSKCAASFVKPYQHSLVADKLPLQIGLTLTGILPLICVVNIIGRALISLAKSEYNCWAEAKQYARTQYILKDTQFIWPHFLARVLYNHMPVWGAANAINNGALTTYSNFGGEDIVLSELSQKQMTKAGLAGATGFTRSYGFFWLTKGPRDHEMKEMDQTIDLEPDTVKVNWCKESRFWSQPESPFSGPDSTVSSSAHSVAESPQC